MSISFIYWFLLLLWLLFGFVILWPSPTAAGSFVWLPLGGNLLLFTLFVLIGLKVFGSPIKKE